MSYRRSYRVACCRLVSLEEGGGELPCSLVLLHSEAEKVVGHVRLYAVAGNTAGVLVEACESVVWSVSRARQLTTSPAVLVSREWRGKGLGRKLMAAAEQHAADLQYRSVHLSTHDKQDFYRHLGYEGGPPTTALRSCVAKLDQAQVSSVSSQKPTNSLQAQVLFCEEATSQDSMPILPTSLPLHPTPSLTSTSAPPPPPLPPPLPASPTASSSYCLTWMKKSIFQ